MDLIDDLGTRRNTGVPVASGFCDVYSEAGPDTPSMQAQVISLLDKYRASDQPIGRLYITGYSLASALSELFTLDLARPDVKVASNDNFACPRGGNAEFVNF